MTKPSFADRDAAREPLLGNVSRETLKRLEIYEDLLVRWQKVKNLVAPSTLPGLWTRHFADLAQLALLEQDALVWADLGSGAGFPGLVVAILLADKAGALVHLVESDRRKCAFLREVARATGAPVKIHDVRAESVVSSLQGVEIVTARALTALPALLELSAPLLKNGAQGLFLKGQDVASELTDTPIFSMLDLEFLPSSTDAGGRIVRVKWRNSRANSVIIPRN